jgi:SAM-dependent methyltransferase
MKTKEEYSNYINEDYFNYLTKRLDDGTGNNVFVFESIKIIKDELELNPIVNLLDLGCFSGALLNNILSNLSGMERDRIRAVGVDINESVLERGSHKYLDIIFLVSNLEKSLPLISQYNILLLSNTLHEIVNNHSNELINDSVKVLEKMVFLLKTGGKIIFLDGVKPDKNMTIKVKFFNNYYEKFKEFSEIYLTHPINYSEDNKLICIDLISLSTFFSKERYLETSFWDKESNEIYQLFSKKEILEIFKYLDLKIITKEVQFYKEDYINSILEVITPKKVKIPKNILITAEKQL